MGAKAPVDGRSSSGFANILRISLATRPGECLRPMPDAQAEYTVDSQFEFEHFLGISGDNRSAPGSASILIVNFRFTILYQILEPGFPLLNNFLIVQSCIGIRR